MTFRLLRVFHLLFLLFPCSYLLSQTKSLDWEQIEVDAYLGKDGSLEITETQSIRFSGDWNGAYRRYDLGMGEKIKFISLDRKLENGTWISLKSGSLYYTDEFQYDQLRHEIKWRSRMPSDKPFDNTILVYKIKVKYMDILRREGGDKFRLDHDFGFSDRKGDIGRMSIHLKVHEDWKIPGKFENSLTFLSNSPLSPDQKMIVQLDLRYTGTEIKSFSPSPLRIYFFRGIELILIICGLGILNFLIYIYAKKIGIMDEPIRIDSWKLFYEILSDTKPEYVAILAESGMTETWMTRLTNEGKLRLSYSEKTNIILRKLVEDEAFSETDQKILKDLFVYGGREVSSNQIKEYYKSKKTSYSLNSDIERHYTNEMERLAFLEPRNSWIEKSFGFIFDKVFFNSFVFILSAIVFGLFYYFYLSEPLNSVGVGFGRFFASIPFTIMSAVVVSSFEDVHYGIHDVELYRERYFVSRFLRSLIPLFILNAFFIWSLEIPSEIYFYILLASSFLSAQHIIRLSPLSHKKQIKKTLEILSLKNFLSGRLSSSEPCDIPIQLAPFIPAFDLTFNLRYRSENLNLNDAEYLFPENISKQMELHLPNQTSLSSLGSSGISSSIVSNAGSSSFSSSNGNFGGGGASASWSDMEAFSSSARYSPPSTSSSSSSSSSSGGGGGGGW